MDKTAIKNYAVWARRKLIEDITQKAFEYGITENEISAVDESEHRIKSNNRVLIEKEIKQRASLVSFINEKARKTDDFRDAFQEAIEEVAYTWFNRIIAIRFMEVNGYLPTGVRVLSSEEEGKAVPDIVTEALNLDLDLNLDKVNKFYDEHDDNGLFRYLFIKQCNKLGEILPNLFEKIEDYTELLLPDNLLLEGSVIRRLVSDVSEDDFREQVEIIGWMYQYYNSEIKDAVIQAKKRYTEDEIPYATQLFTPDWIVRYMVQNSLGRYWLEGHSNPELQSQWEFYLEQSTEDSESKAELEEIKEKTKNIKPEEIKVFDPCMGSGHILVYAFDVLYEIYKSEGYSERDIPKLIIEKNIYGLDIDDRAFQLAYFAIMMKARSKNRRFFRESNDVFINICAIQESPTYPKAVADHIIDKSSLACDKTQLKKDIDYLLKIFENAKVCGSLIKVESLDYESLFSLVKSLAESNDITDFNALLPLIRQASLLNMQYDIVSTNPPYMNSKYMPSDLFDYILKNYKNNKSDLFAAFMECIFNRTRSMGQIGLVTPYVWMFISSYQSIREQIVNGKSISSLIQLEYNAFESACVPVCTLTFRNYKINLAGEFINLSDFKGIEQQPKKALEAIINKLCGYRYLTKSDKFKTMPGMPIAYWISNNVKHVYEAGVPLGEISSPRKGNSTSDNNRFLRLWYEVDNMLINFNKKEIIKSETQIARWFPYNKGGGYRKWYGYNEYLIDWKNDAEEIRSIPTAVIANYQYFMKDGLTWSTVSSKKFSIRAFGNGFIFDNGGCCLFTDQKHKMYYLSLLNSKVFEYIFSKINPTLNFQSGEVAKFPVLMEENKLSAINDYSKCNINLSKIDWDSFETSWDFKKHPFLTYRFYNDQTQKVSDYCPLKLVYELWEKTTLRHFNQLKANEEELNHIFIDIYGLQDELTPEESDEDVTIRKADKVRDVKSFISYAVGCMLGRYSIDADGLIYAGGGWADKWHDDKVRKIEKDEDGNIVTDTWVDATFLPDEDNVLPILDDEYFDDDIVGRFVEFLKIAFGEKTLDQNLDFIADTLGKKASETSKQTIRRYFLNDFFKDHAQIYHNRPIYWLFDSGKQNGFKALIYMHRYDEATVARVRTDYLHKLQKKYESEAKHLEILIDSSVSQHEKAMSMKRHEKIKKQMEECLQYDQVIAHVANQRISIDLDDGVVVNYAKFQGIEVPQGEGKKPKTANLLAKI